jgi:prepilin-type processing-associated H-X9-DG protein
LAANPSGGGNYLFADGHVKYLQVTYAYSHRDLFNVVKN